MKKCLCASLAVIGCLCASALSVSAAGRVGVLDCGLGSGTNAFGASTAPRSFVRALGGAYDVRVVPHDRARSEGLYDRARTDLLVVPTGSLFPQAHAKDLVAFLRKGGLLLTCGGYAFDDPMFFVNGTWRQPSRDDEPVVVCTTPLTLPPVSAWREQAFAGSKTDVSAATGENGQPAVRIATPKMKRYNLAGVTLPKEPDLAHRGALSFRVKASPTVSTLRVELNERDGSRWKANYSLSNGWQTITLTWADLEYHGDSPTGRKRGQEGDRIRMPDATTLVIGFTYQGNDVDKPMEVLVADLRTGPDPFADKRHHLLARARINTHHYDSGWSSEPRPDQIPVFSPAYLFKTVPTVRNDALTKDLFPSVSLAGSFAGHDASAQLTPKISGHAPCCATLRPVLACRGSDGALKGRAASLAYHFTSTFRGSAWALFGVESADLFATPANDALLKATVDALFRRTFLALTMPTFACYRAGEQVELKASVFNFGTAPRAGRVRFTVYDEAGTRLLSDEAAYSAAAGGKAAAVAVRFPQPASGDWFRFESELLDAEGRVMDREENAFCVWREETIAKGPKFARVGTQFTVDGVPRFLVGAQAFVARSAAHTSASALPLYRNFKQMREQEMLVSRNFFGWSYESFVKSREDAERLLRLMDACVLLSQKFGIVNYFNPVCGNVIPLDAAGQAAEAKDIAFFAARYRTVPGFLLDVRNEARIEWRKGKPDDRALAETFETWARTLTGAAKRGNPSVEVATGWSQGWGGGPHVKDPPTACRPFTFTDCHYYGRNDEHLPEMKKIDRRVFGQPAVLGECGVAFNPARVPFSDSFATEEEAARRYRCQAIRTFGEGYSFMSNYGWSDHVEGNFTFAFCHWDNNPRDVLAVYAKLARVLSRMPLAPNPPTAALVLSDARLDGGETRRKTLVAYSLGVSALSWWGVNYSVVTESDRAKLPADMRLIVTTDELLAAGFGDDSVGQEAARDYVGARIKASGVAFTRQPSDPATLETYRVPGVGSTAWAFWNGDATKSVRVTRGGLALTIGPERGGYLQISADGRLEAAEEL